MNLPTELCIFRQQDVKSKIIIERTSLKGRLNASSNPGCEKKTIEHLNSYVDKNVDCLIVECSQVESLSSATIRAFLEAILHFEQKNKKLFFIGFRGEMLDLLQKAAIFPLLFSSQENS